MRVEVQHSVTDERVRSYEHHSIDEPAIMLGSAFAVGVQGN